VKNILFYCFLIFNVGVATVYAETVLIDGRNIRGDIDNVTSVSTTAADGTRLIGVHNTGDPANAVDGDCWWNKTLHKWRCKDVNTVVNVGPP